MSYLETQTEKYFTNEKITSAFLNKDNLLIAMHDGNKSSIKIMNLTNKQEMVIGNLNQEVN